ncbi:hypothetical protein EON83_21850 [bacterium]|nr:MAG: hypothetical protein EON83_21850 [bacterium]
MKLNQLSGVGGFSLLVAGSTLLFAFAGCGGSSGNAFPTATPGPTVFATSISTACDSTTYAPNYYGEPDPENLTATPVYNVWRQFPLKVYIPADTDADYRTATIAGLNQWVTASSNAVKYDLVTNAADANVVISYATATATLPPFGVTTLTYDATTHTTTAAQVQLYFYAKSQLSSAALVNQTSAAHEFGHVLGIGPHSSGGNDLMYFARQRAVEPVSTRDINTLRTLYCNVFPTGTAAAVKSTGTSKTVVIKG